MASWLSIPTCISGVSSPDPDPDDDDTLRHNHGVFATGLDTQPRWVVAMRAYALRSAAAIAFSCIPTAPPRTEQTITTMYLPSRDSPLGSAGQEIPVTVWHEAPFGSGHLEGDLVTPANDSNIELADGVKIPAAEVEPIRKGRPALINFHGGGFVLGSSTDDRIWTSMAQQSLGATVFSVGYRLAPSYPFPTAVHDCVDAIIEIWNRAPALGIDRENIFLSGFSAGGSLALAAWLVINCGDRWDYPVHPEISIRGLILFYPGLDWTIARRNKREACGRPDLTLPESMTDLFDCSYIYPPLNEEARRDWRLSPGLMSDEMIAKLPPIHFVACEHDMLLAEERLFIDRVKAAGIPVTWRFVAGEKHAWDKPMPVAPKDSVAVEYSVAIETMQAWLQTETSVEVSSEAGPSTVPEDSVDVVQDGD